MSGKTASPTRASVRSVRDRIEAVVEPESVVRSSMSLDALNRPSLAARNIAGPSRRALSAPNCLRQSMPLTAPA
jgi:hypothetical protein